MNGRAVVNVDVAIIGAGSGGLSAAAGCAGLGLRTLLFEKAEMGGDCLNYGCVPSKALLSAARRAEACRSASKYGILVKNPVADWAKVQAHVRAAIATIAPNDSAERFEAMGVQVIREAAAFAGPDRLVSASHEVRARRIIVATGSTARIPPVSGLEDAPYLTNETIFALDKLPQHLVVMGGGPIGCELGQAFARLGSKVTILDRGSALCRAEPDHARIVIARMIAEGVNVIENSEIVSLHAGEQATVDVRIHDADGAAKTVQASHVLLAAGRRPMLDGLNLSGGNVAFDANGVKTTPALRSVSNKRVWALGDAAGRGQFTHLAGWHASVFVRNALFKTRARSDGLPLPSVTYTEPELASLGMTEAQARASGKAVTVVNWPFADNDRAVAEADTEGGIRIVTDRSGRLLGGSIVGSGAGDIMQILALAMSNRLTIRALTNFISPYPTRAEIVRRAAGKWYEPVVFGTRARQLVHWLKKIP